MNSETIEYINSFKYLSLYTVDKEISYFGKINDDRKINTFVRIRRLINWKMKKDSIKLRI